MGRKLPECFLWFCFFGVGDQSFSSCWSSACQNKKLWFCVVTIVFFFFFLKILYSGLTLERNTRGVGVKDTFKILQSLKQNDTPSDFGNFHEVVL